MKKILLTLGLCSLFLVPSTTVSAQSIETKAEKKELKDEKKEIELAKQAQKNVANIEGLNFSFYPNTIEPEFGLSNPISQGMSDFYFTVDKDVMYMNLPYLGRFYVTPMSPENIPIRLTSSKFLYGVHTVDGINFHITIVPQDLISVLNDGLKLDFYINKNTNYARLVITADNRQDVTYTGTFN